jgi:hypothetical protein
MEEVVDFFLEIEGAGLVIFNSHHESNTPTTRLFFIDISLIVRNAQTIPGRIPGW